MKRTTLLILSASTLLWAGKNPSDYPMRFQVVTVSTTERPRLGVSVLGRANLLDGDTSYAVDYHGDCGFSFQSYPVSAHVSSPALWKKQPYEVEVLFTKEGHSDKYDSCTLKIGVMLSGKAYVGKPGGYALLDCKNGKNCPAIWGTK